MSKLWTPPRVSREYRDETQARDAEIMGMLETRGPVMAEWNPELERIDPYLRLVRAKEDAESPGVIPGYYHLLRVAPGAPLTLLPIHGPGFEFQEPTLATLERLRGGDLQNARVIRDRAAAEKREQEARERERAREAEERRDEVLERWRAITETQVSMNRASPWSQNRAGRRGARKDN